MKLYLMFTVLVLSSLLNYEVQGIRLAKVTLSAKIHQEIIKISSINGSNQDHELLPRTAELSSGMNREPTAKITSPSTTTTIYSKNNKNDENKHDPTLEIKSTRRLVEKNILLDSSPENSKHGKEVTTERYSDIIDIAGMDYTPAGKKSPIHN